MMLNSSNEFRLRIQAPAFFVLFACAWAFCNNALAVVPADANAAAAEVETEELFDLSIEELLELDVTSVSRHEESIRTAPAAVHVITEEDIARSGARQIPELLRMVPGLQVSRMDAGKWAIAARGFNGRFARHLLVLMDGRTVYSPLFSGTYWELQDTLLHDVKRIEVIRGPGGTMWGANAVNAVINIITKNAAETQGQYAELGVGTEERAFAGYRYGGQLNPDTFYRLYIKGFEHDGGAAERPTADDWRMGRGGFRLDSTPDENNALTLQGDWYQGKTGQTFNNQDEDMFARGGNLLGRWERSLADGDTLALQAYYDYTYRDERAIAEERHTADIDFQHRLGIGSTHELMWGVGYRITSDKLRDSADLPHITIDDDDRTDHLYSLFLQDDIQLVPQRLALTVGSKLEHNDYSGFELQPSARLAFTPSGNQTFWTAVSRAVRTPARLEHGTTIDTNIGFPLTIRSEDSFDSEELWAYEAGHRMRINENLSVDTAVFYHDYDRFQSVVMNPFAWPPAATVGNDLDGETYGVETSVRWQALPWWHLAGSYSFARVCLHVPDGVLDGTSEDLFEEDYPRHQASLRSMMNLTDNVQLDGWLRFVDDIETAEADHRFDEILELDLRLAWQVSKHMRLELVGRNLLDDRHGEYGSSVLYRAETSDVERSVYARIILDF